MPQGYQLTPEEAKAVAENGSARDKAAAASGQFAQTFNQPIANQGVRAGATQVKNAPQLPQGPAKASAAPVAGKENIFKGLCDSLNSYQQDLVKQKKRAIPDQYAIEFAPVSMGASTIKRPGAQDASTAPMQNGATAEKLDTAKNSVNREAQSWPVEAGTQILKVIDNVMRNSSFITDQQNVEITTATDPVTGLQTQKVNAKAGTGDMKWYKISVAATQLGFDNIIRDHAFRMTFIITPYAVAQMTSQYFPDSKYKGVHKAYEYWFTGGNSQILSYEQKYDNAFHLMLSGVGQDQQKNTTTDFRDQNRYVFMATSRDQAVGAKNYANEPANNGASFLYDPTSLSTVRMRIVGDPAWMQQGEAGLGVNAKTFDFSPFGADGSINYDARAVMFSVAFNTPSDYDFNTGIVNVNANNRNGKPQEYYTYQAVTVKNFFSKGRFEQELTGKLIIEKKITPVASEGRPKGAAPAAPAGRQPGTGFGDDGETYTTDSKGNTFKDGALYRAAEVDEDVALPAPQPAAPPAAPTSSGDIDYNAGLAGTGSGELVAAPPNAGNAPTNNNIDDQATKAVRNQALADAAAASGDTNAATFYNRVAQQNRENAAANARTAAKYGAVTTPPQQIAKDDS